MNGIHWRPVLPGCPGAHGLWTALLGWTLLTTLPAGAGPLHDPFLEQFQVGTWPRAGSVRLVDGYPQGLLDPAVLDSVWVEAVAQVLAEPGPVRSNDISATLLRALYPAGGDSTWRRTARNALDDLIAGRSGSPRVRFLRPERLTRAFGSAVANKHPAAATELAGTILAQAAELDLTARQKLVWQLRQHQTALLAGTPLSEPDVLWPILIELGPFDSINAWALWAAYRLDRGNPVLPQSGDQEVLARFLSRLPAGTLTGPDLAGSGLSQDWQSALGAILLEKQDLRAHFKKFPQPPTRFTQQGLWVRGQRRLRKGLAGSYEQLAARRALKSGWQMDVWRRASELRVLRGAWVEGLADLREALSLAGQGSGTKGLRRRLRQWTEQALVLALVQDDLRTARELRQLGLDHFKGPERDAFAREISHWAPRLDRKTRSVTTEPDDSVDLARLTIAAGQAPDLRPAGTQDQSAFRIASKGSLWALWRQWGLALADPEPLTGRKRERAVIYRNFLLDWKPGQTEAANVQAALKLVALRLGEQPWLADLLRTAVDVDAGRICQWQTPPRPSPVPALLPEVRGSELDRHALLGFCLAIRDMRGILGLAYELPARGLTRAQKRLFLYPLPGDDAINRAIGAADNEPALLLAIARNESLFEPAVRSRAGALGWMQIMPFHYPLKGAAVGAKNWRVPAVSVQRGDGLLTENRRRYQGDAYRAVAAYNAGPGAAGRWDKQLGGAAERDVYLAWIGYPETRAYVEKVLIDREVYREIIGAQNATSISGPVTGSANE